MVNETNKVLELPILKHFEKTDISFNPQNWRKGEKGIATIVGIVLLGTIAWGLYSFILPIVFTWVGQALGAIAAAVLVIAFFIMLPVITKALKRLARTLHKMLIKYDPFGELEDQKQKMIQNREQFKQAKAKIKAIKSNMESESMKAEKEAKDYQDKVLVLQTKAEAIKKKMADMEQSMGVAAAKETDEYVEMQTGIMKVLSEAQRVSHMLNQSTGLVRKYGSRAHVIGKLDRKLNMVDTAMEIKIADFEVSIDMLQKEYAFAEAARNATEQAKSAMLFTKGWELEYALDVVTNTIALDLATTKENLLDLDSLTSQYSMDSDELYSKLDKLADQIKTDSFVVPQSKKYANPNYKLTQEDKIESKGFGDIF
jgi:predicted  nucleic acid-binding Zn-ribbon protein